MGLRIRSSSPEIRTAFGEWIVSEWRAGTQLVVLEGLTASGKTTLTKHPFPLGNLCSTNIELDDFLNRPVPETTPYVDAIDRHALDASITSSLTKAPLTITQGTIAWPLVANVTGLESGRIRRVYLKRMRYLDPNFWADEDFIFDQEWWPPTIFHRSIYQYHAEQRPWLAADLVLERIEDNALT